MVIAARSLRLLPIVLPLLAASLPAKADCYAFSFGVSQPIVENFIFRRSDILADNPRGGETLQRQISIIVASSRASRPRVFALLKKANRRQVDAIASGIGLAASRCRAKSPMEAREIEKAVRNLRDTEVLQAFNMSFRNPEKALADLENARKGEALSESLQSGMPVRSGRVPLGGDEIDAPGRVDPIRPIPRFSR